MTAPWWQLCVPEWRQVDDGFLLVRRRWLVPTWRVTRLDRHGVEIGVVWRRLWTWNQIAVVSWDTSKAAAVALCLYGNPYPKMLPPAVWSWSAAQGLLDPIRDYVEAMGATVMDRGEPATCWWYLEPGASQRR